MDGAHIVAVLGGLVAAALTGLLVAGCARLSRRPSHRVPARPRGMAPDEYAYYFLGGPVPDGRFALRPDGVLYHEGSTPPFDGQPSGHGPAAPQAIPSGHRPLPR
jgi:hypothetical protein